MVEEIHINITLQKSISALISNVLSSLCQQFIQYEHSLGIFGILSVNIDDDIDVAVKINECFTKNEAASNLTNSDCSKLIETIKKNVEKEIITNQMDKNKIFEEVNLISENNEIDDFELKRKPRKFDQIYHNLNDGVQQNSELSTLINKTFDNYSKFESDPTINEENLESPPDFEKIHNYHKKAFNLNSTITEDEVKESNSERLFRCTLCDQTFKKRICLARHKRTHQNIKSYKCNICGLGFELINQLKRHLRNVHKYSQDNLRNFCAKYHKIESSTVQMANNLSAQNYPWPTLSTLPIFTAASSLLDPQQILPDYSLLPFSYSSGQVVSQSNNKAIFNTFISPPSLSRHFQEGQGFNPIIPGSESLLPYNNPLYYLHYSPILPVTSLYSSILTNPKITTNNDNLDTSLTQRHINSLSLESMPLMPSIPSTKEDCSVEGLMNSIIP